MQKINFKPLHDGVGFHPFSEGLPYAPQTKTEMKQESKPRNTAPAINTGAGAMSAGTPKFAPPLTTRQMQQKKPVAQAQPIVETAAPVIAKKVPTQTILRKRVFAYLLDTVVHLGFWITINLIATLGFHFELDGALLEKNLGGFLFFFAFSQWFFISMQEMLFENSIGKSFFGLEFKRNRKSFFGSSLFIRSIVFMMGLLAGGLGLYFRPQDKIAEIQLKHP